MSMGFKQTTRSMDFADLAVANCLEQNRSIKLMDQLSNTINWSRVESILLSHYTACPVKILSDAYAFPRLSTAIAVTRKAKQNLTG
jgi:hypothetical protein